MARPLRLLVPDGVYHVTARGNGRASIYRDDRDREAFLKALSRTISRLDWRCLSYCLMDNHFHLLVRTPEPNLPRGVQQLKSSYAQWHNRRHDRVGHLFAGRYSAVLVQADAHLLEVFRYIALNPVRAGLCAEPAAWVWSAHPGLAGQAPPRAFVAVEEVHALFAGASGVDGPRAYRQFVGDETETNYPSEGVVFGDEEFMRSLLPAARPDTEIPVRDWGAGRPPLAEILSADDSDRAIALAYRVHGYTMPAIAAQLGCHVATVGRRLRAYEAEMR